MFYKIILLNLTFIVLIVNGFYVPKSGHRKFDTKLQRQEENEKHLLNWLNNYQEKLQMNGFYVIASENDVKQKNINLSTYKKSKFFFSSNYKQLIDFYKVLLDLYLFLLRLIFLFY